MFTVADARRYAVNLFAQSANLASHTRSSWTLDADVLLQHFLQKPRAWLFAHDDADISEIQPAFCTAAEKRCAGFPIAYITGKKEFWGLPFLVTPDVLIPKPDTELMVEKSISILKEKAAASERPLYLLDPCTGSGCVAISILHTLEAENLRNICCVAVDISPAALDIARLNAQRLLSPTLQTRLLILEGDMRALTDTAKCASGFFSLHDDNRCHCTSGNSARFDLIAANPPYVPSTLTQNLLKDGRNEPALALDGGADGLDFIKILANNTPALLNDKGVLLSEIGDYHAKDACLLFKKAGFSDIRIYQDWAQQDRLIEGVYHDTKN